MNKNKENKKEANFIVNGNVKKLRSPPLVDVFRHYDIRHHYAPVLYNHLRNEMRSNFSLFALS